MSMSRSGKAKRFVPHLSIAKAGCHGDMGNAEVQLKRSFCHVKQAWVKILYLDMGLFKTENLRTRGP